MFQSGYSSIAGVFKAEMFPAHVRALGVALPYAIANAVFGGSAEYVALWFKQEGMESGFYFYTSAVLAVGLLVVLILPDPGAQQPDRGRLAPRTAQKVPEGL